MKARLHSKMSLGWDGKPELKEHVCKWVKVEGKKITIFIHENYSVIGNTDYYDLEIVD